jgi:cytochrome oxidase Cu insertion factor (SCO1/SenC/PrrC family)
VLLAVGAVALLALGVALGSRGGGSEETSGGLAEGTPAPEVRLPSTTGDTVDLADFRGKRNVLLYFYEHAG